jgi:hypothetical protein
MEERFIPALFSVLQLRAEQLHPVAREALVRSYSWYLAGVFLPDVPNEQEEEASFLRRWVLSYRDQEKVWQKNLSDQNTELSALSLELMRSKASVDELGEMAAFALGAGVLARHVWRNEVTQDETAHLEILLNNLKQAGALTMHGVDDDDESIDWEAFWRPVWVMQDLLRFPRVIEHVTQSCQNVFSAMMSGEALARWAKLSHLRLADSLRKGTNSVATIDESHNDGARQVEQASERFATLLNHLALQYWASETSSDNRQSLGAELFATSDMAPVKFDGWKTKIHAQRLVLAEQGRNPTPAFYAAPPPYPMDSVPPKVGSADDEDTQDIEGLALEDSEAETVEGLPMSSDVNTDPPVSADTDLSESSAATEEDSKLSLEEDTSENDNSNVDSAVNEDSSESAEEKSP